MTWKLERTNSFELSIACIHSKSPKTNRQVQMRQAHKKKQHANSVLIHLHDLPLFGTYIVARRGTDHLHPPPSHRWHSTARHRLFNPHPPSRSAASGATASTGHVPGPARPAGAVQSVPESMWSVWSAICNVHFGTQRYLWRVDIVAHNCRCGGRRCKSNASPPPPGHLACAQYLMEKRGDAVRVGGTAVAAVAARNGHIARIVGKVHTSTLHCVSHGPRKAFSPSPMDFLPVMCIACLT